MEGNFLVAVAIFLLILVILHGSGCLCRDDCPPHQRKMTVQKTLEAPAGAAVAGGTADTVPAVTTVTPDPAGASVVNYEFAAPKKSEGTSAAAAAAAGGSPPLSESFDPIGVLRASFRVSDSKVKPVPSASASVIRTDRDLAGLFKNRSERMHDERHQVSDETEAKFAAEKLPARSDDLFPAGIARRQKNKKHKKERLSNNPLFPPGQARRQKAKKYEKEMFVDANGRWQSFMYYHVGNDGDPRVIAMDEPRALGDYVDVDEVPKVSTVVDGTSPTGEEVALRKSKEHFKAASMLDNFVFNTRAGVQQAWKDATGRPLGPSPVFVVSPKKERMTGNASDLKGPRTIRTPDGRCLGVVGGRDGTKLNVTPCQPTARNNMQSWEFGANSSNGYQIRASEHSGSSHCLTSLPDGELQLMPCLDVPQQGWALSNKFGVGAKQIKNQSGNCMTIIDGALGVSPKVGSCNGPQAQWKF